MRKGVEWDGDDNVKHVWEQMKLIIVESAREVKGGKEFKECLLE